MGYQIGGGDGVGNFGGSVVKNEKSATGGGLNQLTLNATGSSYQRGTTYPAFSASSLVGK